MNEMKYFDRHACMSDDTMDLISMCKTELFRIKHNASEKSLAFGSVANMLAGLYDGFDYANAIRNDNEMEVISAESPLLYFTIHGILETIDLYPKFHKNEAIY